MPAKNGFTLTSDDMELLRWTHELRIVTIDHLAALSGRSEIALWRRLRKLRERHYLTSVARLFQKHVFAVGSEAVPALIEAGFAPQSLAEKRIRHYELKEIGLRHSVFVADIHLRLLLLTKAGPIKVAHWQEGPALWDSVVARAGEPALPVRPDAYFILHHTERPEGKNRLHLFLEADRSTMSHQRMEQKVRGYIAYHEQQRHARKYADMKSFRLATVTQTRGRAKELQSGLQHLIPTAPMQRAYRFIAFDDLTLDALLPPAGEQKVF
jgi:hypothetical protein